MEYCNSKAKDVKDLSSTLLDGFETGRLKEQMKRDVLGRLEEGSEKIETGQSTESNNEGADGWAEYDYKVYRRTLIYLVWAEYLKTAVG